MTSRKAFIKYPILTAFLERWPSAFLCFHVKNGMLLHRSSEKMHFCRMKHLFTFWLLTLSVLRVSADIIITNPFNSNFSTGGYVFLDVNVDGINDYLLRAFNNGSQTKITARGYNGCQIEAATDGLAMGLSLNAPVGNNVWKDTATVIGFDQGLYYFPSNANAFLGLKLSKGGQTFYGYIMMNISGGGSLNIASIYNFAYENIANRPIFAGSFVSVANKEMAQTIRLFVNENILHFKELPSDVKQLNIMDLSGRTIKVCPLMQQEGQFPLALPQGVYLAIIQNRQGQVLSTLKFASRVE